MIVKNYLIENKVPESKITSFGFGSLLPVGDNATMEGRIQNNRVEVVLFDKSLSR